MVRITIPLLPWFGQLLPIYRGPYKKQGREQVIIETPLGIHRAIPLSWTDWYPRAQCPVLDGQPVLLEGGRLLSIVDWVDLANAEKLTYQDKKERYSIDENELHRDRTHGETAGSYVVAARHGDRARGYDRSISARSSSTMGRSDDRKADSKSRESRDR
jgi:hypothetical protein